MEWLGIFLFGVLPVFFFVTHFIDEEREKKRERLRRQILAEKDQEIHDLKQAAWMKERGL